jgi:hypothetical protein
MTQQVSISAVRMVDGQSMSLPPPLVAERWSLAAAGEERSDEPDVGCNELLGVNRFMMCLWVQEWTQVSLQF